MFITKSQLEKEVRKIHNRIDNSLANAHLRINETNAELRKMHKNDDDKLKLTEDLPIAKQTIAVRDQKIEMLNKIVDLNANVIDVKELVTNLINKFSDVKIGGTLTADKTVKKKA